MRPLRLSSSACLLLTTVLAAACPAPGGETTGATASSTTTETGTGTGTTTSPTSGATTSSPGTTGGTGSGSTGGSATTSTDPGTTDATAGPSSTTDTAGSSTTGTTGSSTTGAPAGACAGDGDCKLHSDCCTCAGAPIDEDIATCDEECKQPKCSEYGVDLAVCRFGVCTTERLSCDETQVVCDSLPPPCPPGELAETSPACWTGKCVPAALCDVVPECGLCPAGTLCVQNVGRGPQGWPWCEPIPADCGGQVDCDCVGDLVCADPFPFCTAQGDVVSCECINC